jgi:hypothetical protein
VFFRRHESLLPSKTKTLPQPGAQKAPLRISLEGQLLLVRLLPIFEETKSITEENCQYSWMMFQGSLIAS